MSTSDTGDAGLAARVLASAKAALIPAPPATQLELDVTPEDIAEARETLGPNAGNLTVLRKARELCRGRPAGAKNKRTDDFARWILSFGRHPAVGMVMLANTPPEVLIENSKRTVKRVTKSGNVVEIEESMSYEAALGLRQRAGEALLPYLESKKPVAVDMTFNGIADLMIQGVTHTDREMQELIEEADFMSVDDDVEAPRE